VVQIISLAPQHWVPDVIDTAEFYRDVLGFTFTRFHGDPPGFVILERDGARLMFRTARQGHPPPASNWSKPGDLTDIYLYVEDVAALAAELRAKGAEIVREPEMQEYAVKELHVRDCNGRLLCFGQLME
jgi:catechol 2,3-dioxygenase-like lactoylglutathione lyase family enzyme